MRAVDSGGRVGDLDRRRGALLAVLLDVGVVREAASVRGVALVAALL